MDFRGQGDSSPEPLLKRLKVWLKPARLPEVRLPLKADQSRIRDFPARKRGLTMIGGAGFRALRQLHKLAPEDVIQPQFSGDFPRDVQPMCPMSIDVDFLKNENIGIRMRQEIYDCRQLQTTINIPIHNSQGTAWPQ